MGGGLLRSPGRVGAVLVCGRSGGSDASSPSTCSSHLEEGRARSGESDEAALGVAATSSGESAERHAAGEVEVRFPR